MHSSRRQFLGGAAVTGAGVMLPFGGKLAEAVAAPTGPPTAKPDLVRRGRAIATSPRGDLLLLAHAGRRSVAVVDRRRRTTKLVDLPGQPLQVAVSTDGSVGAVTTAYWETPGLTLIDLPSGRVRGRIDVGPAPFGVGFTRGGRHLVVSGGEQDGDLRIVDLERSTVVSRTILGRVPRYVAVGDAAWVTLQGDAAVIRVDVKSGRITKKIAAPPYPDELALSPDGRRLLIGHRSGTSEISVVSGRIRQLQTGRHPSGLAYGPSGTRLIALGDAAEILSIGRSGRRRHLRVNPGPRGLAIAGRRAFTVSNLTGAVSAVRI